MQFLMLLIAIALNLTTWAAPYRILPVTFIQSNDIPPRLQWNHNSGYCGEVSLISAGLYYGQYISQYDTRAIATQGAPQNKDQLLLGINDQYAATQMRLKFIEWQEETTTEQFLAWVKQNVIRGFPVAIGVYTNEYLFYGKTDPNAGDPDYDHIVPVTGITSLRPLTDPFYYGNELIYSDDEIYFNDNGLWGDPGKEPCYFSYPFDSFYATRAQANSPDGPVYSLSSDGTNYGIAITGVIDLNGDTLPVRIDTNLNYELPQIVSGSPTRPKPMPLLLTVTVSGLDTYTPYNLYRYNSVDKIPTSRFNAQAGNATQSWQIQVETGTTYTMQVSIMSDETAAFRCVRATAH